MKFIIGKTISKMILTIGYLVFIIAMLLLSIGFFEVNKLILNAEGLTVTVYAYVKSEIIILNPGMVFVNLFDALKELAPNISVVHEQNFLGCKVDVGDYDFGAYPLYIFLTIVYILLPVLGFWTMEFKRWLFHFKYVFWVADKQVFTSQAIFHCEKCCGTLAEEAENADKAGKNIWDKLVDDMITDLWMGDATMADVDEVRRNVNERIDDLDDSFEDGRIRAFKEGISLKKDLTMQDLAEIDDQFEDLSDTDIELSDLEN
eukprot:TRINITY_DN2203_c0_g1_i1.p1 TRINITY_DN2203_c0_g1~~TRINITY_DN2203_c0_g1_i1.p1  ORF type:complete len:297 (+),score=34.86 TRINITY_DN2203_c0_g1_i1:113-892(+)